MMKQKMLFAVLLLMTAFSAKADNCSVTEFPGIAISFQVNAIDPTVDPHEFHKNPIEVPLVYIEDYTLLFEANHPDYILYIKDEDDVVVYSTAVYSAQTQVVLPSTLSGDYKVELVMGDWLFTGWINL